MMSSRKGVSPLIAVVLLIVFTVAISTMIMSWMNKYTKDTTTAVGENTDTLMECSKQIIKIPRTTGVRTNNENVTVIIENIGQSSSTIKKIVAYDDELVPCTVFDNETSLDIGDFQSFSMNCSAEFGAGAMAISSVRATTKCGGIYDEWINTSQ